MLSKTRQVEGSEGRHAVNALKRTVRLEGAMQEKPPVDLPPSKQKRFRGKPLWMKIDQLPL
jgi:hypothetical protein